MTRRHRLHDSARFRIGSPLQAAVILLGFYVTLSLALGGLIHMLTAPEAAIAMARPSVLVLAPTEASPRSEAPLPMLPVERR